MISPSLHQKVLELVACGKASNYKDGCRLLAARPKKRKPPKPAPRTPGQSYWWDK